jgi:hypothetical protein
MVEFISVDDSEELLWVYSSTEEERAKEFVSKNNYSKRERYKEWFNEYKSKFRCVICKEQSPEALHFHHLDPKEKKLAISEMIKSCMRLDRIDKELEKCVVLCSNCHNKAHRGQLELEEIKSEAVIEFEEQNPSRLGYGRWFYATYASYVRRVDSRLLFR